MILTPLASAITQYTEGDTDASITGSALMWEDSSDTLRPVSASKPLPVTSTELNTIAGVIRAEDSTYVSGDSGIMALGVINSNAAALAAEGDYCAVNVDNRGRVQLSGVVNGGLVVGEDSPHVSTEGGIMAMAVQKATPANLAGTDGDYEPLQVSGGRLWTSATITSSALPTGAATDTKQDAQTAILTTIDADTGAIAASLAAIDIDTTTIIGHVDGIETLLTTISGNVDGVETSLTTLNAKDFATQTTLAAINAKLVTGTDIGDVTINNAAGASAVNIQDGGNSITVDGAVTVSGTVAATQSGTWNITNISGTISLPTGAATSANQTTEITHLATIAGAIRAEDDPHSSGHTGIMGLGVINSNASALAVEGDYVPFGLDNRGRVILAGVANGGLVVAEDAQHVSTEGGIMAMAVQKATPANLAGTDGDYEPLQVSAGRLWTSSTITSSALPTGAATSANQLTEITSLATIVTHIDGVETLLGTIDASLNNIEAAVLAADSLPTTPAMTRPSMTANATSQILASNSLRKKAIVMNNTANVQWIKEGVSGVLSEGFPVYPGGLYNVVTTAAVHGWNDGGVVNLDVLEATS